jgi:hypothetical protein
MNNIKKYMTRACSMLAGAVMTLGAVSCSESDEPAEGTYNWNINGNEVIDIKPERYKNLKNPMTGWVLYTGLGDGLRDDFWEVYDNYPTSEGNVKVSDYASVLYIRAAWTYFNPEEGVYVWEQPASASKYARRFHMLVDGAKERGLKLAFTFICDSQDKHDNFTPNYVREAGAKGFMTTTGSVQVWSPYCDDPIFQKKYTAFLQAFAKKYNDPDITMFMSGFGLGKWGESHTVNYSTGNATPREAVVDWVSDAYLQAFTKVPCVINYHRCLMDTKSFSDSDTDVSARILDKLVAKGYSLRHDAYGMKGYYKDWERNYALANRFNRPLIAEGGWVESSHGGSIKGDGYADHGEVRRGEYNEAKNTYVNMMDFRYSNSMTSGETWRWFNNCFDLVKEFISEGGYRLYPDKISLPKSVSGNGTATMVHRWSNLGWGYCPTNIPQWNQKYKVAFALLDKTTSQPVKVFVDLAPCLNEWVKGKPATYEFSFNLGGVAAGNYTWAVGIVDTTKDNEIGLQVSAKGDITPEGWVKLSDVNVN